MTLPANFNASPRNGGDPSAAEPRSWRPPVAAFERSLARGFAELDERVASGAAGVVVARAPTRDAALALGTHAGRRVAAAGCLLVHARASEGAALWADVAARLGLAQLAHDPSDCAQQIAQLAASRRAAIVAPLPVAGTWDRAVAAELSALASPPLLVLVGWSADGAADLRADVFEVGATLDEQDVRRWWRAVADEANPVSDELAKIDAWWRALPRDLPPAGSPQSIDARARALLSALALVGRAWPLEALADLGGDRAAADTLVDVGAARIERGFLALDTTWDERAKACADAAAADSLVAIATALAGRLPSDPWALARAAELLARAGALDEADRVHARAITMAEDVVARRELVARWMRAVDALPRDAQLALRVRAADRALAVGEAEEAHRWAHSAAMLAPEDVRITLLFGRSAVALGDLVSARVALERGRTLTEDDEARALIAVELAEAAYLNGDLVAGAREANEALLLSADARTRLKARNTLGKLLLAESKWDEADRHFAEDAWTAAASGLSTDELRARLNRGIALLSKGLVDEARAIFEHVHAEGERLGDARACAFALDNLAVVATNRHDYASALTLSERTLKLRQRLGDRLTTARILANLAEIRRKLGLLDHAEHAVAFGRRTLGPGMPPARSARFCIVAAKIAIARGNTGEARREIARAIVDFEAAGMREYVGEAHRVSARIALEDGDHARGAESLASARELATTDDARAEIALLSALAARAAGEPDEKIALDALALARAIGEEEWLLEAYTLLFEMHRASGNVDAARVYLDQAIGLRDQVAESLPCDVRGAFLARADVTALARLQSQLSEPSVVAGNEAPRTQRSPRAAPNGPRELVGDDPAVRALMLAVRKVARSSQTILVRGESGTGKELLAEAIHRASERVQGPMVSVNCAALVETLLLSELFGHEKGAFTGAIARRRGRFELAEGGTLFLDEIGDISPRTQVALLRVLQEKTFERVGGTTPIRADVRIICATHRDLRAMVERGEFREDLYYRLRGITLELPPLRARMGDLPRISDHLLTRIAAERNETPKALTSDAIELLARHKWPGNIRELENALRAAALFAESVEITASHLIENVDDLRAVAPQASQLGRQQRPSWLPPPPSFGQSFGSGEHPIAAPLEAPSADEEADDVDTPLPIDEANATAVAYAQVRQGALSLSDMKRQIERDCIARALAETKGNITRAAALLGMKRPRLSQLVKQYGLAAVSSEGS